MPGVIKSEESTNGTIDVRKLHPTFAAEIRGLDLSTAPNEKTFAQIRAAVHKVNDLISLHEPEDFALWESELIMVL